jgi:hypothetical protein
MEQIVNTVVGIYRGIPRYVIMPKHLILNNSSFALLNNYKSITFKKEILYAFARLYL